MTIRFSRWAAPLAAGLGLMAASTLGASAEDIKIAHVYGKTGALEAYAKQSHTGLMMGLEYATDGTMEVDGRKIVVIEKDTQLKPDIGKRRLAEAYGDDEVDVAVGPVSSGVALAMLPVAEEYEKILIVEPAVADSITGAELEPLHLPDFPELVPGCNCQRSCSWSAEGVSIATLAQDYAFGRDGVAAFKEALEGTGANLVFEEYAPTDTKDFTANAQRIFDA
jgi:branched-chain amino acid transport system substrate-binding protein